MAESNANSNAGSDPFAPTRLITTATTLDGTPVAAESLDPPEGPHPSGTTPHETAEAERAANATPSIGSGVEGEEVVWEGRYSMKNFLGRIVLRAFATVAWIALAVWTWGATAATTSPS